MIKGIIHANPANHPLENKNNAKYYPYWNKVIEKFPDIDWYQLGVQGNHIINNVKPLFNLPLKEVYKICLNSDLVCCIDSFLPHLLAPSEKKIIVVYTVSDPEIFGYNHNINLYKDKKYFRENQFDVWTNYAWKEETCVSEEEICEQIKNILYKKDDK